MGKIWNLEQYRGRTALMDEYGTEMTYDQLDVESSTLAGHVGGRCLVFCLCSNVIGSVFGYISFINHAIVPALLNAHIDRELLNNLLNLYHPAYLWLPKEQIGQFPETKSIHEAYGYALLKTGYHNNPTLYEELALLLTTSGSTGSPKFVRQSYTNVLDNAQSIAEYLELDETERPITTLPMNYTYGLSIINSHLLVGASILVTRKTLMQKEFWKFFKEAEATSFGGVPYTYEMLDKLRFYQMELPSLRAMTQAGGKLLPALHEKFAMYAKERGKKFVVMYGQCEATARMGYLPPGKAVEKKGFMGIAIPGGKFHLIGDDGKEIFTPETTGELVYEGKNVTLGYAECGEDLKKGNEWHGVLKTGDMAQFDEDGYYSIVGRKKRFLKIYGNRINLDDVEHMIKEEFGIETASAGVDDHMLLFVTDKEYAEPVKAFVVHKTKLNPAAFQVVTIESIPKNDSGKTLYQELTKYYAKYKL